VLFAVYYFEHKKDTPTSFQQDIWAELRYGEITGKKMKQREKRRKKHTV
jgi:hypothetical protein